MRIADVVVISPVGKTDSRLAIAACRAGARGILSLEFASADAGREALADLRKFTTAPFGIQLGVEALSCLADWLEDAGEQLAWVVIPGDAAGLPQLVQTVKDANCEAWVEAINTAQMRSAVAHQADGLILKGHEAGGRIGEETSFILLQRWQQISAETNRTDLPVWVRGGIGLRTAAACVVAGARGVVLDSQLLLTREAGATSEERQRLAALDGSETLCLGESLGAAFRVYTRPGLVVIAEAERDELRLVNATIPVAEKRTAWEATLSRLVGEGLNPLGQDAAFASALATKYTTVAGILDAVVEETNANLATARDIKPLRESSPLAKEHSTLYPLLQGPMTRVSDTAAFAHAVAQGGGLPFLALALLRGPETETLLKETKERLGNLSWGVGILGFMPVEIRKEQLAAVHKFKPPFALIAGGRPDQAAELEKARIPTYLHVPSPGLLRMFLKDGARRFIFEGRECGGHVGPRTSFVLWESMLDVIDEHLAKGGRGEEISLVFAGGIHDSLSAAMVSVLAAPLAKKGVKIGALMGTAYLFTQEAVAGGAIVERFQQEAVKCAETVLLKTAPGHAIRCVPTPYCDDFEKERLRLQGEGRSYEEIAKTLEWQNIGRLRVASKGLDRSTEPGAGSQLADVPSEEQFTRGMYMIGQVASLRAEVTTIADLHADVIAGSVQRLEKITPIITDTSEPHPEPCDVAIVGLASFYPGSSSVDEYWQNILDKVYTVTEVPDSHWDWRLYYNADPKAPDKIISKWGGFLRDIRFDPLLFGITPNSLHSIEPLQLFLLEATRLALTDAGYANRPFPRARTAAILGIGGGGSPLAVAYGFRTCLPLLDTVPGLGVTGDETLAKSKSLLPEWTEDSFPGILLNVAVGRVANRFNLGGPNYAIDAACGSSLAAVYACVRELQMGTSDMAVAMGADTVSTPYAYMAFSKTHALSAQGRCRPFDAAADGIVLSEGIGAIVLKRVSDAVRDGDRIYAVIKGMGTSSDGKDKGLTAPRAEGQLRALRRAYGQARVSPAEVGLIEAHGTGTVVGDQTEATAMSQMMREYGAAPQSCAMGSVKSMIGHSKCAAGIAGLIKGALALHHQTLPPTLVEKPNAKFNFEEGPLYLNTEARPWVHGGKGPRHAGVSAFGFGGTNFHAVLAEYQGDFVSEPTSAWKKWPGEVCVWSASDRAVLATKLEACLSGLTAGTAATLADIAAGSWKVSPPQPHQPTLSVVAKSLDDLREKLTTALAQIKSTVPRFSDLRGIYFAEQPGEHGGRIAFLFPGQGSQYPNMAGQTALAFAEVREALDRAEGELADQLEEPLGRFIYPGTAFTPERERQQREKLTRSDVAQPAIGAVSVGLMKLLEKLGVAPAFTAGHSYGEFVALHAAGVLSESDLIRISHRRGSVIRQSTAAMPGGMLALDTDAAQAAELLVPGAQIANSNSPLQTVIAGSDAALLKVAENAAAKHLRAQRLPVACAFHSPLVAAATQPLAKVFAECEFLPPRFPVFANVTAQPHAEQPAEISQVMVQHLTSPVRFREEVEALYAAGARVFLEVGPQAVLTGLVGQTLKDRPHLALATDTKGRPGLLQIVHVVAQLVAHGVRVKPERLFQGRDVRPVDPANVASVTPPKVSPTTWMVNSVRNRPINAPEPTLLGQRRVEAQPTPPTPKTVAPAAPLPPKPPVSVPAPQPIASPMTAASHSTNGHSNGHANGSHPAPRIAEAVNGNGHAGNLPQDEATQVLLRFQDLMAKFLDTQKSVMTAYLTGTAPSGAVAPLPLSAPFHLPSRPAETNGVVAKAAESNGHTQPAAVNSTASTPTPLPAVTTPTVPVAATATLAAVEAPQPVEPSAPKRDRNWLTNHLQDLLSQRTGYPREMLGLDLNLEADLGIDSIKRVEILAEVAQALGGGDEQSLPAGLEMEKLTAISTLRGIIDYLEQTLLGGGAPAATQSVSSAQTNGEAKHVSPDMTALPVQRGLVKLVDCPLAASPTALMSGGTVLITDDGQGIAAETAARLADLGWRPVMLRNATGPMLSNNDVFTADLSNPAEVTALVAQLQESYSDLAGFLHLLPLAGDSGSEKWDSRARREVKSLYLFAKHLEETLRASGKQRYAFFVAATSLGGAFGFGEEALPPSYFAGHGGLLGFLKSLGREWPEVMIRGVDLDIDNQRPGDIVEKLLGELCDADGPFEIGYRGNKRLTWLPEAGPLDTSIPSQLTLAPGAPVLITGGARGITAAIAQELARRFQPNLFIVGRSPLPAESESAETAGLKSAAEIKAAIMARIEREGRPPAPSQVEAQYQRLLQDREIRANLKKIAAAGAKVEYIPCDVRDEATFGKLLDNLQSRHGGLAGVIHGAGVIEDRLVRSKTPESFDKVFDTKVVSARILSEKLRTESLKFCALFASLASRYGNKGQADYSAANEVLSKLALELNRRWEARVFAVAWGPWSGIGMVADLEKHLTGRGLRLISPEEGPVMLCDELQFGAKRDAEVIIAGGTMDLVEPAKREQAETA